MTHRINSFPTPGTRKSYGEFPTYLEARAAAYRMFDIVHYDRDETVAFDAADFLTKSGEVYSIDPVTEGEAK